MRNCYRVPCNCMCCFENLFACVGNAEQVDVVGRPCSPVGPASEQLANSEEEFQQMVAALKTNDTERQAAIATCIAQGIGDNPVGVAKFMGVPMERAAESWWTRVANGIANGLLTLADVTGLGEGVVTPNAQKC